MKPRQIAVVLTAVALAACATTAPPHGAAPPVKVVVTSEPEVKEYVRPEKLVQVTEQALRQFASDAAPGTITIHFTSITAAPDVNSGIDQRTYPEQQVTEGHQYPIISTQPWNEGVRQRETTVSSSPPLSSTRQAVMGTYAIADASGKVLERRHVYAAISYRDEPPDRVLADQRNIAEYLAKRVAKLSGKQQG